jgi:hypothetical protein
VPSKHGLGLDDDERISPARPDAGESDPEGAVDGCEAGTRLECVGRELLAEGDLDDCLLSPTAEEGGDGSKKDRHVAEKDSDHVAILREDAAKCETDYESEAGIPSVVDRAIAERRKFNYSGAEGY